MLAASWILMFGIACGDQRSPSGELGQAPAPNPWQAMAQGGGFHRMGTPMSGDWLVEFDESGQTYEAWLRSRPNRPHAGRRRIYIQPVGELGPRAPQLATLSRYVELYFGLPVRVLPAFAIDDLEVRERTNAHTAQRQLHAEDILTWMRSWVPKDAYAVIGLTAVDLYPDDDWNFVFGMGSFKDRVGIYSLARYSPSFYRREAHNVPGGETTILRRTLKIMAHEIGHIFGVRHCTHFECVMNGSNSLGETDRRPMHLCPLELRKLENAVGFDLEKRYRALSSFYLEYGLPQEASWSSAQADRLSATGPGRPR